MKNKNYRTKSRRLSALTSNKNRNYKKRNYKLISKKINKGLSNNNWP